MRGAVPLLLPYAFIKLVGKILRIVLDLHLFDVSEIQGEQHDLSRA
jgi:hypothetical protein